MGMPCPYLCLQVRASNLQELVYKQGQAGVTKATVSITWHNNEPKTGPAGYEDKEYITITRQVVIGGRNKYLINGHAAQEKCVLYGLWCKVRAHGLLVLLACRLHARALCHTVLTILLAFLILTQTLVAVLPSACLPGPAAACRICSTACS